METDEAVKGFAAEPVEALRYNATSASPHESFGILLSMISEGARVLDIGCGSGALATLMRQHRHANIIGVEPNLERAKRAQEAGFQVVNGFYSDEIPERFGKFDVILFADVLEHMENPVKILEHVKAGLKENGRILASIPNVAHWSVRLRLIAGQFDYKPTGIMDATHLRWFTRKTVRRVFSDAGYDIEHFYSAAGAWIRDYRYTPLRLLPYEIRSATLSKFCSVAPGLFAVQHVVSAVPRLGS